MPKHRKKIDLPTPTLSCRPFSQHRFDIAREIDMGKGAKQLDVRCKRCNLVGIVWTKPMRRPSYKTDRRQMDIAFRRTA